MARLIDLPPDLFAVRTNSDKQPFPKRQKFVNYLLSASQSPNRVNAMVFDQNDTLWAQTDGGIYRGDFDSSGSLRFGMVMEGNTSSSGYERSSSPTTASGTRNRKRVPWPSAIGLVSSTEPPISTILRCTIASPRPVPRDFVE